MGNSGMAGKRAEVIQHLVLFALGGKFIISWNNTTCLWELLPEEHKAAARHTVLLSPKVLFFQKDFYFIRRLNLSTGLRAISPLQVISIGFVLILRIGFFHFKKREFAFIRFKYVYFQPINV